MIKIISAGCVCVDVFVEENEIKPGGESLNFCGNVCRLPDVDCSLISNIGRDSYGSVILKSLEEMPINISHLRVTDGVTANHKILHTASGDRFFPEDAWDGGVLDGFRLTEYDLKMLHAADAVHTQFDSPLFPQILEARKQGRFLLAVDFNDYRDFDEWEKLLGSIDLFFISGTLEDDNREILKRWSEHFDGIFTQTLAEAGSVAYRHGKEYLCDAVPVGDIVDTTGAGDSYIAGFTACITGGGDIPSAMQAGSELAAVNIARLGGF